MSDESLLLLTDLDRTLLPNGPQAESPQARKRFKNIVNLPNVQLGYVSGRHLSLVEQAITNYALPEPDYILADVGTSIYSATRPGFQLWSAWSDEISPDWGGYQHEDLKRLLGGVANLRLQELTKQSAFKLSYYAPLQTDQHKLLAQIDQRLSANQIHASLIWSIDEPAGLGLLDILPKRANKLAAIEFVRKQIHLGVEQCLFAGDSGNDLEVLSSAIPSVLVANASESVRSVALETAKAKGFMDRLYLAQGHFFGMNGNYSAGILEGLAHYHPSYGAKIASS